jgi:inner membrane protein
VPTSTRISTNASYRACSRHVQPCYLLRNSWRGVSRAGRCNTSVETFTTFSVSIGSCELTNRCSQIPAPASIDQKFPSAFGWLVCCARLFQNLDVIGFRFGIHGDFWGHRGFTHSLVVASLLAGMVAFAMFRYGISGIGRFGLFGYLFLATASHGVLDAMTNGGLGVAFFSPFDNRRYLLPWRPIHVSPIAVHRFFSARGFVILQNEAIWIWVPAILFATVVLTLRRRTEQQ